MVRYTSGYICAPLTEDEADRLELPPMYHTNQDRRGTAYTVTVDAREGVTHRHLGRRPGAHHPAARRSGRPRPADLSRPGHVVPLRAKAGGVLRRPGHTEAAIDLAALAGLRPAGVLCELVNDDGTMMRLPDLEKFAAEHDLALITHRRPGRLPAAHREAGRAGRRDPAADRARRVHRGRLPGRRTTAPSTSRWSTATSATARTCWSGCTPSA